MKKGWFLSKDGTKLGPYSWEELWQEAKDGNIASEDLVWTHGLDDWVRASRVHGLTNIPESVTTAPPPPNKIKKPADRSKTGQNAAAKNKPSGSKVGISNNTLVIALVVAAIIVLPILAGSLYYTFFSYRGPVHEQEVVTEEVEEGIDLPEPLEREEVQEFVGAGNTSGNLVNGGLAALSNQWVYFRSNQGGSLQRQHIADLETEIISADSAWFINVSGNWVFYSNRDDKNRIYRVRADGSERKAITFDGAWFVTLIDDLIYYVNEDDDYRIYRVNVDGADKSALSEDSAWFINVVEDWIYFVNRSRESHIYRIRVDGRNLEQLNETSSCCLNITANGWIYFVNEEDSSRLYRMRVDGSEETALTDHPVWFVNAAEDKIYYAHEYDNFSVYSMDFGSGGVEQVTGGPARYLVIAEDWIYYLDHAEEDTIYRVNTDGSGRVPAGKAF